MNRKVDKPLVRIEYRDFLGKANAYIQEQRKNGIRHTPEQARIGLDALSVFSLPDLDVENITDAVVSLPDRDIPIRIYDPQPEQIKPVIIYMHGGGHMCGSVDLYDAVTRRLAARTGQLVVSIDYRLAPEFPYPCGLDDCLAVVDQLESLLVDYRVKLDHITLAGDSAGGALASSVAWQTENKKIQRLVLLYPGLDYTFSTASYEALATGYLLETEKIQWYFDQYFKQDVDRKMASPLFFPRLDNMPKTLILAAELDPLVDEGKLFHQRLIRAGVDCDYYEYKDVIHCFLNLESLNPELIDDTYERILAFVNS